MRLASFRGPHGPTYGMVTDAGLIDLGRRLGARHPDLKALIAAGALAEARSLAGAPADYRAADVEWLPVIPNPDKIVCVGLNYEEHRVETGRDRTEHPALFLRVADSQVGHLQPLACPRESTHFDYEAEIAVIVGTGGRRIAARAAWDHVAGYSCYNDASVRDWQRHTVQWTAGKNFTGTGAFGPWMVTADEIAPGALMTLSCRLNFYFIDKATTEMMIFKIPRLIEYISTFTTLAAGDVIVTGTPGGVGARRTPPVWMKPGDVVEIEIDRVGVLRNTVARD